MEALARERVAAQNVQYYLTATEEPIASLLSAFEEYRQACQVVIFDDFEGEADRKGRILWYIHTEGKKYFHATLSGLRKQPGDHRVGIRQLIKFYLRFIKDSQRFYLDLIRQINATFGGIPEVEAVVRQVKDEAAGESSQAPISPALRLKTLEACHQCLIYLGDLSRYRASEKLDKIPDFGPAIGYYGLACTLAPSSGMGHHQLAAVALEQQQHLHAIYHLYRSMMVDNPHPNAAKNLKLEIERANAAWERGELIPKSAPNEIEVAKRTLVGWFVRLHSVSFKGEAVRGLYELESEVSGQLAAEIKVRHLDKTLMRMVMVNLAAQHNIGENFKRDPSPQNQNAFFQYFRLNVQTFTTLLRVFYEDMRALSATVTEHEVDAELTDRLTDISRRILPALRMYSSWLLSVVRLLAGLIIEETLKGAIDHFWRLYAKCVDLVAAIFPIWDLEDLAEVSYMLEEDGDTVGFKPLQHERTMKVWHEKSTGAEKPRFSSPHIIRASVDEEMLTRVKDFLTDGLYLANDDDKAPIKLRGTRILHRDAEDVEPLPVPEPKEAPRPKPAPKPLSYAAAAANANSRASGMHAKVDGIPQPVKPADGMNGLPSKTANLSQQDELIRMVDDLVDDDETNTPVTPPQQHGGDAVLVMKGDGSYSARLGYPKSFPEPPKHSDRPKQPPIGTPAAGTSPSLRTPKKAGPVTPVDRLQSLSGLWNGGQGQIPSSFPSGLPTGTMASPAQFHSHNHSRVNSASSIRSRASQQGNAIADSWSSLDFAPTATAPVGDTSGFGNGITALEHNSLAKPLLFGAGGGVWSTRPTSRGKNTTPPSGQGG